MIFSPLKKPIDLTLQISLPKVVLLRIGDSSCIRRARQLDKLRRALTSDDVGAIGDSKVRNQLGEATYGDRFIDICARNFKDDVFREDLRKESVFFVGGQKALEGDDVLDGGYGGQGLG